MRLLSPIGRLLSKYNAPDHVFALYWFYYETAAAIQPYHWLGLTIHFYEGVTLLRHQIIENRTASHPEKAAEAAIVLWEQLATQIIAIIGVGGFNSLFARSLFLTQSRFPWLTGCALSLPVDQRFTALKNGLEAQAPGDALEANSRLLRTFTDILAALIGEALTSSILRSAWGDPAPAQVQQEVKE